MSKEDAEERLRRRMGWIEMSRRGRELGEIRERSFKPKTKKELKEIAEKRNEFGFFSEGELRLEDVRTVFQAVGEIMDLGNNSLFAYIMSRFQKGSVESPGRDIFGERNLGGLSVGVAAAITEDEFARTLGYGIRLRIPGEKDALDEQLIFEVGRKLDEVGIPLVEGSS
jgi:hypothetical protein